MSIAENLEAIEERIAQACLRCGRKREEITLMGVTKFQPVEAVDEAWKAGLRCFGESRVQEAAAKFENFREGHPDTELHLIGALQRNKAKLAASLFDSVDCLDRESLAVELTKHTAARNSGSQREPLPVLLEFRTGEDSKSGFTSLDDLFRTVELILACPSLSIRGLMTIAPNTREDKILRSAFRRLVEVRQELERRFPAESRPTEGRNWNCLSMGMSGDFETAIEEGSTLLRVGTAIFGERI
jgi:pyridoxal phosphate enzyme (YggS family)